MIHDCDFPSKVSREPSYPDPSVGGLAIDIYFVARFRENVEIGHTVSINGPSGYDFSTYCENIIAIECTSCHFNTTPSGTKTLLTPRPFHDPELLLMVLEDVFVSIH